MNFLALKQQSHINEFLRLYCSLSQHVNQNKEGL
jgi:hypothetical protein